ncbi:MAG: MerR family transcriptional regulator [Caulobacteraceae bacterium]|nr:MAG: MerR family transcriptional regulator [Caulobacteraceae bacterium]
MAKGPEAFRTISEAADEIGVAQHVLRFWESKFSFLRPMKRAGGRRFYRPQDIALLLGVRGLLYNEGYTIKAVQKLHRDEGAKRIVEAGLAPIEAGPEPDRSPPPVKAVGPEVSAALTAALADLLKAKSRLDGLLE